ncbi:MAG: protein kinase domain-containing protein, partial [Planctomycetota bacterium]
MGKEKQIIAERFEVIEELGLGALGPVLLVQDRKSEWQKRVLRVIGSEFAEPEWVRRFEFEFHERAGISHQHLAKLHDFGSLEDRFYYTTEFVTGTTFETWAPGHNIESVLTAAAQVLRGLHALHANGFNHGDVKPENIILLEAPSGFHAKLVDQAIVTRPLGSAGRRFAGTPAYLAPEAARRNRLDGRADLYALGACLYEAVSGRRAVSGGTIRDLIRNLDSYSPSDLLTIAPGVPPGVAGIIMKLLSKNPSERIGDANRVIVAFSETLKKELPLELEHGHPDLLAPGVVGREKVWERCRTFLTEVMGGGTGHRAMLLSGPSGSGLSVTLDELSAIAEMEDFRVIHANVIPHEGANDAIQVITNGILALTGAAHGSASPPIMSISQAVNSYFSTPGQAPDRAVTLISNLLNAAANHSICLVMDDLHLAGPRRREFVLIMLDILRRDMGQNRKICLLGSFESKAGTESLAHLLVREDLAEVIELGPLNIEETKQTLCGILGQPEVPEDFATAVHTASDGIPRAIVNCVRLAVDDGKMPRSARGDWQYPKDLKVIRKETPEDITRKLIAGLDDQTRDVICACATFEKSFNLDDIGDLMRERPKVIFPVLRKLISKGFIREDAQGFFSVSSGFMRRAITAAVPDRHVKANHRRLGMHKLALAERGQDSERVGAAHHLLEADDRKYGLPLALEVIDNCISGGDAETANGLIEQIIRHEIVPASDKKEQLSILEKRVRVSSLFSEDREALSALWEAVSLTKGDSQHADVFPVLALEQANTALSVGDLNVAGEALAILTSSTADISRLQPQIDAAAALLSVKRGDSENALAAIETALSQNPPSGVAELLHARAEALAKLGRLEEALAATDQAAAAAGDLGNSPLLLNILLSRCNYLKRLGRSSELEHTALSALNVAREQRLYREQAQLHLEHASTILARGEFVNAEDELVWVAIFCLSMNRLNLAIDAYIELSNAAILDGRYSEADTYSKRAYLHARTISSSTDTINAFRRLAWCALVKGDFERAGTFVNEAESIAERFGMEALEAACMADRARLAFLVGDNAGAESLARTAKDKFKSNLRDPHAFRPAELLLDILFTCGRYSEIPGELEEIST